MISPENDPRPPDCSYDLFGCIGSGGCADVYRAINPEHPTIAAAVKIQKPGLLSRRRFRREIDVARRLDHSHIMPVIDASPADAWYAMPLADGTLEDLHDRDPYDWEELRKVLSSICGALMHAHANGVIHRDVSPDNVLELPGGHWVLSDFGLARFAQPARSVTPAGTLFGKPIFSAPEVNHDPREATPASDAYSIAAIASWFTKISRQQRLTSDPGRYWSELIRAGLSYQPEERWSVSRIAYHLELAPAAEPMVVVGRNDPPCARCGAPELHDGAGRCVRCGFLDEI